MQPNGALQNVYYPTPAQCQVLESRSPKVIYNNLVSGNFIAGACTPFTRELYQTYGLLSGYTHLEDYPRYLHLSRNGVLIRFMKRPIIKYLLGGIPTVYNKIPALIAADMKFRRTFTSLP